MPRPIKWSRDAHLIREKAVRSKTETWSRGDIEHLFGVGRASAQSLTKAIGEVQAVGGAHFVERLKLLAFLDEIIQAPSLEESLRSRLAGAEKPPRPKPLRIALPHDLRNVMVRDLPPNIQLSPGRLEIVDSSAAGILENLVLLAQAMQNDLAQVETLLEPVGNPSLSSEELGRFLTKLRHDRS